MKFFDKNYSHERLLVANL